MPLVSVIMPVYNGEKFVGAAIESVLAQTFADFELLIVDDASRDGSAEIIRACAKRDERIRFLQHERNGGQAVAQNTAIANAQGKYIAPMDCDDVSLPDRLVKQVDFLEAHDEIDIVGVRMQEVDENLKPLSRYAVPERHVDIVLKLFFAEPSLGGAVVMMRRACLEAVGGFDSRLGSTCDTDLFARLAGRARFANLPEPLYLYRQHSANASWTRREANRAMARDIRERWLLRMWGGAPPDAITRLDRLRHGEKFGWRERPALRRDLDALIEAMIASNAVDSEDRPILEAEMKRRLESTMPRPWQMLLHWRRHHFGRRGGGAE